ncbi:hypothetical protein SUGI_1008830 [Cryptomeria japonica]|nr:hypothetical protein SUGI_1008830 [Cryptomeria japonica]
MYDKAPNDSIELHASTNIEVMINKVDKTAALDTNSDHSNRVDDTSDKVVEKKLEEGAYVEASKSAYNGEFLSHYNDISSCVSNLLPNRVYGEECSGQFQPL